MKQSDFEYKNSSSWQAFDEICESLSVSANLSDAIKAYQFPKRYRKLCHQLALAKSRHYSPQLINSLHKRVLIGHQILYQKRSSYLLRVYTFIGTTFPQQLRKHARFFWLAAVLFYLPLIVMGLLTYHDNQIIYTLIDDSTVSKIEYMYDPQNKSIGRDELRQSQTNTMMFGYYIYNNISIAFQAFAMGILAGVGTVFILLFNGLYIGSVAGHLTKLGFGETFWGFVAGHGAFELTAIVISGAAGLRLAMPLYAPGPYRRMDAIKIAGRQSVQLMLGAMVMLLVAAFIEAYWSSASLPSALKYTVGFLGWLLVAGFLVFSGRHQRTQNRSGSYDISPAPRADDK